MAIKQTVVSDISEKEVPDEQHARLVIRHPDVTFPVELDVSTDEAEKFQNTALRLVEVTVYGPNTPPRKVTIETKILDKLFTGVDFNKVIEGARKAEEPAPRASRGRPAKAAATKSTGDKLNYTDLDNIGLLHRGRITEEESRLVRENPDRASANRERQTGKAIDWKDAKEKQRYGL